MGDESFDQAPVAPGDVLAAKYRVERVLGVGGMGVVVAARHLDLDQPVALKFPLAKAAQRPEHVQRFLKEARATVRLTGVHVAKTLDVGRLDDGRPYIVMEYLEGRDLADELHARGGTLPIDEAVSYVLQACDGIAEAHALGIVHRDLKPANLFLTKGSDGRPLVKVLDFGISKTLDPSPESMSLTRTDAVLGSPFYMSPEQLRASRSVDPRADVWAIGAIAFELVTGHLPFAAESIMDLCLKVANEPAPDLRTLRSDVPEALSAVVRRCLSKEPAARFADVGALATALAPFAPDDVRGLANHTVQVLATKRATSLAPSGEPPADSSPSGARVRIGVPSGPAAAWGTTHAVAPAPKRRFVLGGVIVAASVAIAATATLRFGYDKKIAAAAAPSESGATATPTATPTTTSTATPTAASTATPTAMSAPTPTASAPVVSTLRGHPFRPHREPKPTAGPKITTPTSSAAANPAPPTPAAAAAPAGSDFIPVRE